MGFCKSLTVLRPKIFEKAYDSKFSMEFQIFGAWHFKQYLEHKNRPVTMVGPKVDAHGKCSSAFWNILGKKQLSWTG